MARSETDHASKKPTSGTSVKYPDVRRRLLELMAEDQEDRQPGKFYDDPSKPDPSRIDEWIRRDQARADELLAFLEQIKSPSARNIGLDGSRAAWLIAQHNPDYKNLGPRMLRKMKYLYYRDKSQVYCQGIPYLVDRLMIHRVARGSNWQHTAKQLYGTQAYYDEQGRMHSFFIVDRKNLLNRLRNFDLDISACIGLSGDAASG